MLNPFSKKLSRLLIVEGHLPKIFLAALIGAFVGLLSVLFHGALESAIVFVRSFFEGGISPKLFFVAPFLGGLLVGIFLWITQTPEAAGQGTDAMISAFHHHGGKVRARVLPVKFFASILTLSSGGSAGYEGPVSQIGAGAASNFCRFFKMPDSLRRQFMLAGTAAGLGAIFKAPLAGALTSVEVLYREDFESKAFATSIVSSVVAFTVYTAFLGGEPVIGGVPAFPFTNLPELIASALLGICCMPFSWLYVFSYERSEALFSKMRLPKFFKPALGGLLTGGIILIFPMVSGGGFEFLMELLSGMPTYTFASIGLLLAIVLGKILATALTVGSGGAGGVFGPSLFIGGVLGALFALLFEMIFPGLLRFPSAMILIGMGAFFAGASKAPIAGVVMVCEMTGSYSLLPGLLMASVMHIAFSRGWSLYKSQVLNRFFSPAHRAEMDVDVLRIVSVGEVFEKKTMKPLETSESLAEVFDSLSTSGVIPVFDGEKYLGIFEQSLLQGAWISAPELLKHLLVADCVVKAPLLKESDDLHEALRIFVRTGLSELCVIDFFGKISGTLSHSAVFKAYDKMVH